MLYQIRGFSCQIIYAKKNVIISQLCITSAHPNIPAMLSLPNKIIKADRTAIYNAENRDKIVIILSDK